MPPCALGSARELNRLCQFHAAYRWICGGVSMNYHTLSDFRTGHVEQQDRLLTESVASLMAEGLVTLDRVGALRRNEGSRPVQVRLPSVVSRRWKRR